MKYDEIVVTVLLKRDIPLNQVGEKQGELIKSVMEKSKHLSALHASKQVKLFCFDYLYPRAENKLFHENRVYYFILRTPVKETALEFSKVLSDFENENFIIVASQLKHKVFHVKTELYTSTPAVCTLGEKYWTNALGLDVVEEKIEKNLVTKYKAFFGEAPLVERGFINYIQLKNTKPIALRYKAGQLVGNKFLVGFGTDETSIKMAYLAYTTSLLEKSSSLGSGFCI